MHWTESGNHLPIQLSARKQIGVVPEMSNYLVEWFCQIFDLTGYYLLFCWLARLHHLIQLGMCGRAALTHVTQEDFRLTVLGGRLLYVYMSVRWSNLYCSALQTVSLHVHSLTIFQIISLSTRRPRCDRRQGGVRDGEQQHLPGVCSSLSTSYCYLDHPTWRPQGRGKMRSK